MRNKLLLFSTLTFLIAGCGKTTADLEQPVIDDTESVLYDTESVAVTEEPFELSTEAYDFTDVEFETDLGSQQSIAGRKFKTPTGDVWDLQADRKANIAGKDCEFDFYRSDQVEPVLNQVDPDLVEGCKEFLEDTVSLDSNDRVLLRIIDGSDEHIYYGITHRHTMYLVELTDDCHELLTLERITE